MIEVINGLTYFGTVLLSAFAVYSIINSINLTRGKVYSSSRENVEVTFERLGSLAPANSHYEENITFSKEELLKAMRVALFERYEFKQKRADRILHCFRDFGRPDIIVSSQPLYKDLSIFYNVKSKAFAPKLSHKKTVEKLNLSNLWGSQWHSEERKDFYSAYIFTAGSGGEERQYSIAHGIGLILLRLYTAELMDSSESDEVVDITGFYDFIWGLDEPKDIKQLFHLFPSKVKTIAAEWQIEPPKSLTKSSSGQ